MKKNGVKLHEAGSRAGRPQEFSFRTPDLWTRRHAWCKIYGHFGGGVRGWSAALVALVLLSFYGLAQADVGRTAGTFDVTQEGAATYTIPIFAPRGPNNLEPHIALLYNSQSGYSYVGVGWSISGLSEIYRCDKTVAQDGSAVAVQLQTTDGYCLDGQRLRLTSGGYGAGSSVYQTEIDNFSQVTAESTAGNGPEYWEVQGRDGLTYEYGNINGNSSNSQVIPGSAGTPYQWWLDKVTDRAGNTMIITYSTANASGEVVPSSISWTPSSHGSSQYEYTMVFGYNPTPNSSSASLYGYVAGVQVSNSNQLQSITIQYNGTAVKEYFLTDTPSSATGLELLTGLQECTDSSKTNCLGATSFSYQDGEIGIMPTPTSAASGAASSMVAHYDFTGDGRDDLAFCNGGSPNTIEVAFATGSGYGTPVNTGIACGAIYGDLLGQGKDGILANSGGVWYYYTWTGSSFTGTSTGLAYDSTATQFVLADVNGDGRPDLVELNVVVDSGESIYTRLNTSSSTSPSFSTNNALYWSETDSNVSGAQLQSNTDSEYGNLRRLDFNGDGRDDLAYERKETLYPHGGEVDVLDTFELVSTDGGFSAVHIARTDQSTYTPVTFLNFNNDACTDYLVYGTVYISGCNATVATSILLPGGTNVIGAMDWNGDGRDDILIQDGTTIGVYLSEGTTVSSPIQTSVPYSSSGNYFTFDTTGGGEDLGLWQGVGITYYADNSAGHPPDLLTKITDGYGNWTQPTYVSLAQGAGSTYTPATSAPADYKLYTDPMYVVSQVTYSDPSNPPNATYSDTHSYSGALQSVDGRGFAGFATHTLLDSRNGLSETQGFDQVFPDTGLLASDVVTDTVHSLTVSSVSNSQNSLANAELSSTPYEEIWFPYISNSTRKDYQVYEVGGTENGDLITTATSSFSFDNYGNLTSSSQTLMDNDPGSPYNGYSWTTSVTNTPDVDTNTWCLSLFTQTQVTYSDTYDNSSIPLTRQFVTPDLTNCRYTQVVTAPGTSYQVTETLGYNDSFGNVTSDTVAGLNMSQRQTSITWGTTGQFPTIIQDPVGSADGYEEQIDYDYRFGLKSSGVLIQISGNVQNTPPTQWSYDPFGRLEKETSPDGTSVTWSYNAYSGSDPKPRLVITKQPRDTSGNVISTITQELDMEDRPYLTQANLIDGSTDTVMQKDYDSLGRVVSDEEPYEGSTVGAMTSNYDVLNRLTETQRPTRSGQATTTYLYAGHTTTITDANGNAKTLIYDVNGWVRETKDATGYAVTLGYDAAGSHVLTTDNQGNNQSNPLWKGTVQYGIAPFTVTATDADLGYWQYTFDALGELTAWTDAKGQNFSAKYDGLSRMTDRYERDLYTHWTWGISATAHNLGQLQSVCTGTGANPATCTPSSGYAESETYDFAARLCQRSIAIPADATYTYTQTYNADGLPDILTYPVSTAGYALTLKFGYAYGLLSSIIDASDSNLTLWTANTMDARGQYTQETFGNGVVVNHAFDAVTGLPQSITAGVGGGATLQNNSYLFDAVGNLTQRQDNNAGTTESVYPDSLSRLGYTVGDTSTQMTYDSMGRIATWEAYGNSANVNDYTTAQSGCTYYANAQPHAVRKKTQGTYPPTSFCYDANGNRTTETYNGSVQRSITWMSFNQPAAISAGSSYSNFYYDENHQRFEQSASYSGSPEVTEYIGSLMEKMTNSTGTAYRYYIPAGNNFIVYNRWTNGTNAIDYATKDNINSTAVITDSTGALVVAEKFAALGWNENTSQQETTMASITRHEFTGQEGLDNSGLWLVNMNGRIYNPSGATFYSPDPYIQDPTNTQNYDRYSYAFNNPLTNVDPSGFDTCIEVPESYDFTYFDYSNGSTPFIPEVVASAFTYNVQICLPDTQIPLQPGSGGNGTGAGTTPQHPSNQNLTQQTGQYLQCINQVAQSLDKSANATTSTVNNDGNASSSAKLDALNTALDSLDASTDQLASSSALALGRAFASPAGVLAPTNAAYKYVGAQVQDALEGAAPYLKGAGYIGTAASLSLSTYQGYESGGPTGAVTNFSYSALDATVDTGLIRAGGLSGLGLALAYNALGGSKATAVAAQLTICASKAGIPAPSPPF